MKTHSETHTMNPSSSSGIIPAIEWLHCDPLPRWQAQIERMVSQFAALKPVSKATVRVEQATEGTPRFHLSVLLCVPGPDIVARASGCTFPEALLKTASSVNKTLARRALNARRLNGAARGVKAAHRG